MSGEQIPKSKKKIREKSYDPKVKFDGTLEQMIGMAVKPIEKTKSENK